MKIVFENNLTKEERNLLIKRPAQYRQDAEETAKNICLDVKRRGDGAVLDYNSKLDNCSSRLIRVPAEESEKAKINLSPELSNAIRIAAKNIRTFHESQKTVSQRIQTMDGVVCWRESRPIECVGLYIPAGSAPLPSTVMMLGIPAKLAGCTRIIICSPPRKNGSVDPVVLATAAIVGIDEVYAAGGAQAVAAMAYGTETIPKADKIFGPGNRYVAAAKQFVSNDPDGAAIDIQAGPSEVLIIADDSARADVAAYDLISQAEHDADAQVVLVTNDEQLANNVLQVLPKIIKEFPRQEFISKSLERSYILVAGTLESAVKFSNEYAPEHLILNMQDADKFVPFIMNAGSVFVGKYAPVTAGDYASGTNHTLPTGGTARWSNGVSLDSFQKNITFQSLTESGLKSLASTLTTIAEAEGLQAHARAVVSRISK